MTHISPSAFCVWSVLSTALGTFLLGHLWRFDRFKCLKWTNSAYSGAFKRIMTYTYLISIPLIMIYSFGFAYIKYKEGYVDVLGNIAPKPYSLWSHAHYSAIFPLVLVFSFAWSFEMMTHLEELCFWFFLMSAGPSQSDWFHSPFFKLWIIGSIVAFVYVPAVAIGYRANPLTCEAHMFTAGSIGDLVLTVAFIPILWNFPRFMRKVKAEGVDSSVIIRLRKFYELNLIRVFFRFLMLVPLLTLGSDGLRPHHEVNESLFWTDMLSIVAALGCVVSSMCTVLIFFPRSYEAEYAAHEASGRRSGHIRTHISRHSDEVNPGSDHGYDNNYEDKDEYDDNNSSKSYAMQQSENSQTYLTSQPHLKRSRSRGHVLPMGSMGVVGAKAKEGTRMLQDALSRRFPKRGVDVKTTTSFMPGETIGMSTKKRADIQDTRRTTPTARPGARPPQSLHSHPSMYDGEGGDNYDTSKEGGAALQRKGTYLLTDSPVIGGMRISKGSTFENMEHELNRDDDVEELTLDNPGRTSPMSLPSQQHSPTHQGRVRALPVPPGSRSNSYGSQQRSKSLTSELRRPMTQETYEETVPAYSPPPTASTFRLIEEKKNSPDLTTTITITAPQTRSGMEGIPRGQIHPIGVPPSSDNTTMHAYPPPPKMSSQSRKMRTQYTREATDAFHSPTVGVSAGAGHADGGRQSTGSRSAASNGNRMHVPEGGPGTVVGLTSENVMRHNNMDTRQSQVHPLVKNFTSPLDLFERRPGPGAWAV